MACDIATIQSDACDSQIACITSPKTLLIIIAQLLCEINESGGGTGSGVQVYSGNYSGVAPVFVPSTSPAIAIDTSNGTQWNYYSGGWH